MSTYTKDRKFKKICKILDRKHQGGVASTDGMKFLNTGNPLLRRGLRSINRNPTRHRKMNDKKLAERMNRGYEFIHKFIARCQ